jgi:hypothetical protein
MKAVDEIWPQTGILTMEKMPSIDSNYAEANSWKQKKKDSVCHQQLCCY